ncbi:MULTISPECIES: hypothetical protein [Bacillus cereus group]|uniref:hypothetical protein n=1 Tax=Bacillus cereus group TaxID=86661 RepID=UPI0025705269|nr:hypothetical protein [Bacillus albus]WJE69355.1 hypothetical protein QRY64_21885 [Bacillus albus]HDR7432661.1 hypothetical protein [Bacillus anthracis]
MHWWINLLITAFLIVFGGFIGSLFNGGNLVSPPTLCWAAIVVLFAVLAQFFANKTAKLEDEISTYKTDMSAIMLTKKIDGSKSFDIAFDPQTLTGTFLRNSNYACHIVINSPIKLDSAPDLIISTSTPWDITIGSQSISHIQHAGEYKYFINKDKVSNITGKKYFVYEFNCSFNTSGKQRYTLTAANSKLNTEIRNSLEVH